MNDERLKRIIDFIAENQAKFTTDIQKLREEQTEAAKRTNVLERVCLNLYNTSVEQGKSISEQGKNISEISDSVKELRDGQKETDERLNAVIFMAEKFFSDQNGNSSK